MADSDSRQAANRRNITLTQGYLACRITATSQLPREVNKFLLVIRRSSMRNAHITNI